MGDTLVTGANGFVGGALCQALLDRGHGVQGAVRREAPGGGGRHAVGEIGPDTEWRVALEGVECVVHLAARVHVMDEGAGDPLAEFRRVNVAGTERLAREAAASGVRRLVYVSSIKVNGESTHETPFTEQDEPRPEDPYAVSKLEAERALRRVSSETGLEVVVIRPPLVYGPGVGANFYELLKLVDSGIPLPLRSVGNRRSFVYVYNLADAVARCLEAPEAASETFLVSDGESLSTPRLVSLLFRALGKPPRLVPCPPVLLRAIGRASGRSGTVARLVDSLEIDSGRIQHRLGWSPPYTAEHGLVRTGEWFGEVRKTERGGRA